MLSKKFKKRDNFDLRQKGLKVLSPNRDLPILFFTQLPDQICKTPQNKRPTIARLQFCLSSIYSTSTSPQKLPFDASSLS